MNTDSGPILSSPLPDSRLRDLIEALPDAIVLVNPAGRIAYSNSHADGLFGYRRGELQGKSADSLLPERFRRDHVADLSGYFDHPRTRSLGIATELCCVRHDGNEFPVEIGLIPLDTGEGTLVMSTIRDVTERKRIEHALNEKNIELEAANKELEAFDYSIAHDLRAPLNRIEGFTAMLAQQYGERLDPRGQELLQRIAEAGRSMDQLVEDLLALSTVTRGTLGRRMVDMSALAQSIVAALRKSDPAREVQFDSPAGITVRADPGLLRVVLENLLGNAWKFTKLRPQAHIEMDSLAKGGERIYFVRDNGAGFDVANAGRLFKPFQRLHSGREFEGTGIGLATVQRVVGRHGGRVWAEATPGEGATFFFTLSA